MSKNTTSQDISKAVDANVAKVLLAAQLHHEDRQRALARMEYRAVLTLAGAFAALLTLIGLLLLVL